MLVTVASCAAPLRLAIGQPLGASGTDFLYRVQKGDTLGSLVVRYMGGSTAGYHVLQQHNHLAAHARIVTGSVLRIPFAQIPVLPSSVQVVSARDTFTENHVPIQAGMELPESTSIETGPRGVVTLSFSDLTRVSIGPNTRVALARVRSFARTGLIDVRLHLQDGEIESLVSPAKKGVGRYEISTPTLVTGVRGTRFRVQTSGGVSIASVLEGEVAAQAR